MRHVTKMTRLQVLLCLDSNSRICNTRNYSVIKCVRRVLFHLGRNAKNEASWQLYCFHQHHGILNKRFLPNRWTQNQHSTSSSYHDNCLHFCLTKKRSRLGCSFDDDDQNFMLKYWGQRCDWTYVRHNKWQTSIEIEIPVYKESSICFGPVRQDDNIKSRAFVFICIEAG